MGNTSVINGFSALNAEKYTPKKRLLTNGATVSNGDILYMADAGTVDETVNAGKLIGLAASNMTNGLTGEVVTTAVATRGDFIMVYEDPMLEFTGQITTYAATDPITTLASAACYDGAGTTGVQYVDAGASTNDEIRVVRLWNETNGDQSAVGAYAKCVFMFNSAKHLFGHVA
jgi:hypothetical protein